MITESLETVLSYYRHPGVMTDPGRYMGLMRDLPCVVPDLVKTLQGLVLHVFWAERYDVHLPDDRKAEVQIRAVQPKMTRLLEIDARPLAEARPPAQRLVGNCRDFSTLLASMLKVHGIPARARCGFGTYFMPDHYEDHWMTEYWNAGEQRWVQVDAQLDELQCSTLNITFDPLDMPHGKFVLAGEAWQMARAGRANPDHFGIFQWHGWDFIKGNLLRDFLALNSVEVLPWDSWGLTEVSVSESSPAQMDLFDRLAVLTLGGNEAFAEVRSLYQQNEIFQVPQDWTG